MEKYSRRHVDEEKEIVRGVNSMLNRYIRGITGSNEKGVSLVITFEWHETKVDWKRGTGEVSACAILPGALTVEGRSDSLGDTFP